MKWSTGNTSLSDSDSEIILVVNEWIEYKLVKLTVSWKKNNSTAGLSQDTITVVVGNFA
jgi:hypothetical protein